LLNSPSYLYWINKKQTILFSSINLRPTDSDNSISEKDRKGFYKILFSRRDVRTHFIKKDIQLPIILRILNAAHHAPSVGYSQPWNFIIIKDENTRKKIKDSFI